MFRYLIIAVLLLPAGCTTMSSTMLNRNEHDELYPNEYGLTGATHTKGVPITLEIPTHVDVFITETYYMQRGEGGILEEVKRSRLGRRNLGVNIVSVKTKKVFTVDFKRPAAGSLVYDIAFQDDGASNEQYFKSIANKIEDQTIRQITSSLGALGPLLSARPTAADFSRGESVKKLIVENERVVAYCRFDINELGYEDLVQSFIDKHLTCCHDCTKKPSVTIGPPATLENCKEEAAPAPKEGAPGGLGFRRPSRVENRPYETGDRIPSAPHFRG